MRLMTKFAMDLVFNQARARCRGEAGEVDLLPSPIGHSLSKLCRFRTGRRRSRSHRLGVILPARCSAPGTSHGFGCGSRLQSCLASTPFR